MAAVYRINEKKCATCRWWQGARAIEFRGTAPFYVKVEGSGPCAAWGNASKTPATSCSRWSLWEKL